MTALRQRMANDMTVRGLAENTKLSYRNRPVNGVLDERGGRRRVVGFRPVAATQAFHRRS